MPGINEIMEHGCKYEPDEHLNSPMLYQNVGFNKQKMANFHRIFQGVPDYVEEIIPNTKTNFSMPGKDNRTI